MSNIVENNLGKIVLIGGATVGGIYLAKKLISANNLQSQVSFYLSNVTGNASLNTIKKGRIEITTTLRIINGSSISIPFSIAQAKIIYKGVEIAVSKPDAEIVLGANSTINKQLTFEVPLLSVGLQSDVIVDLATSFLTAGGITAKLASIMGNIAPNISLSTTASVNGITVNVIKKLEPLSTAKGIALSAGERTISDGSAFNKYFQKSSRTNIVLNYDGLIPDVINNMVKIVETHYHETDAIAQLLKGKNTLETSRNIWNFAVKYIRYQNDRVGVEELRTPVRSWNDGQIRYFQNGESGYGIDCDDFAIFCGSILKSLGIPFHFRITKYYHRSYFQHVYLYIPNGNGGQDIIIDPVVDAFNYEKPYTEQADTFNMASLDGAIGSLSGMPIEMLAGFEGVGTVNGKGNDEKSDLYHLIAGTDLEGYDDFCGLGDTRQADDAVYNYLVRTRKVLASNPNAIKAYSSNPTVILSMFDKAIESYYTPQRDAVLEAIAKYEDTLVLNGTIQGINEDGELGGFFKKVAKAVKKVNKQAISVAKKGVKVAVKVAKAVLVTFNPATIIIRNGMLAMMRLNMFHMATKLKYGFLSEQQAKANNVDAELWTKSKKAKDKLMSMFTKLGGKESKMQTAILHGKDVKAMMKVPDKNEKIDDGGDGLGQLGDYGVSATIATAIGVMSPVIALAAKISTAAKGVKDVKNNVASMLPQSTKDNINSKLKSAVSNTVQSVGPKNNNTAEQQNNTAETSQDGSITDAVSQSNNNTNMAEDTAGKAPSFFQKNKKAIFIGVGVITVAAIGTAIYASVSGDKPQQIAQRSTPPNREATAPQGLGRVSQYKKKSKKRRQLAGVSL